MVRGTKLGPYEILEPLGAGGMGEVYKARDTRLNRTVAIKVLNARLAGDPDLRQRLEQEARAVSNLNHAHICTLYDIGQQDGIDFLVLEHLEGETLADRLKKGPLPLDLALRYAIEIAGALDQAHRRGIVHRDLKPGNVMLTKAGTKLLDFGLAKFRSAKLTGDDETAVLTHNLTGEGKIVGTLQYMSPEQLEGKEADARSDIFAFGAVLYEMVSGRTAFEGTNPASLIASILKSDPAPVTSLQPITPATLDRLIGSCLAKDPEERWQSAGDLARELRWVAQPSALASFTPARTPFVLAAATTVALAGLAILSWIHFRERPSLPAESMRFTIATSVGLPSDVAISPDGTHVAFTGQNTQGKVELWVRALDKLIAQPIPGTDDVYYPFWSPDSRQIAFFTGRKLMKVDLSSGQPQTLCDGLSGNLGGDWGRDGTILFSADGNVREGIFRVSSNGGVPVRVTKPENPSVGHGFPIFLPDGKHFLYLNRGYLDHGARSIEVVGSLDGKPPIQLVETQYNARLAPGSSGGPSYLLFGNMNVLMAQEFDLSALKLRGEPIRAVDSIATDGIYNFADASVSDNGTLVYSSALYQYELIWIDRTGNRQGRAIPADLYSHPKLTADGTTAVFERVDPGATDFSIWKVNVDRGDASLLQKGAGGMPVPYPDGATVVFRCVINGASKICRKAMGGAGTTDALWESTSKAAPVDITADARFLTFANPAPAEVWVLPLTGERRPFRFDPSESYQRHGTFSPNGKFLAYTTNETGDMEVYVQPFPATGEKWKVSSGGGAQPRWRRDGQEMFYRTIDGKMMAVPVKMGARFESGVPHMLFQTSADRLFPNLGLSYDVSADGQRFLVNSAIDVSRESPITVVTNWRATLKH